MTRSSPIVLGIFGDSGSGKSTLASGIAWLLGGDRVTDVCLDDYHRYDRRERARLAITALHPDCNRLDLMLEQLRQLQRGETVHKPVYDHRTGTFAPAVDLAPHDHLLVHGLLGLHTPEFVECYDLSVFVDPDPDLRIRWKLQRDITKRGYSEAQVRAQLAHRESDARRFIQPQRSRADMVVSFFPRGGDDPPSVRIGAAGRMRAVVRPMLEDLSLVDAGARWLRHDGDSCTIEIHGSLPNDTARAMADVTAQHMAAHADVDLEHLGSVAEGTGHRHSNPLAVAQSLVAAALLAAAARSLEKQGVGG